MTKLELQLLQEISDKCAELSSEDLIVYFVNRIARKTEHAESLEKEYINNQKRIKKLLDENSSLKAENRALKIKKNNKPQKRIVVIEENV